MLRSYWSIPFTKELPGKNHSHVRLLPTFFISIDIYILFNQHLFGTEAAKVVYAISYFRGIAFNLVKTYVEDFIIHKNNNRQVNTLAKEPTQKIFTSYRTFKNKI
jgi:hypothetical protein